MPAASVLLADLDDTLFDHAHATRAALAHLRDLEPRWSDWEHHAFESRHNEVLELLHQEVLTGRLTVEAARVERFRRLLTAAAPDERDVAERAIGIAQSYRSAYERGWRSVPGARELLMAARARGLRVAVVTNNLQAEQELKLTRCDLAPLVDVLITSERAGAAKPDVRIFETALGALCASAHEAVMFGDAWPTDVIGARTAGIRAVWFNRLLVDSPDPEIPEVRSLLPTADVLETLIGSNPP